jgi:hypothetical protein
VNLVIQIGSLEILDVGRDLVVLAYEVEVEMEAGGGV